MPHHHNIPTIYEQFDTPLSSASLIFTHCLPENLPRSKKPYTIQIQIPQIIVSTDHNRHTILFLLRSSTSRSSSSFSTVSAGFNNEWTLLAMLERRVAGADSRWRDGNFGPPRDQLLSTLSVDGVVSLVGGGVIWLLLGWYGCRGAPSSYCASTSRTC